MAELAVGETVKMDNCTWATSKPIREAEHGEQEKITRILLPSPLSLRVLIPWVGLCMSPLQQWQTDGDSPENKKKLKARWLYAERYLLPWLSNCIKFLKNFLCWKSFQTVIPSPVQVENKLPFSNRDGVGSNINISQLGILHRTAQSFFPYTVGKTKPLLKRHSSLKRGRAKVF